VLIPAHARRIRMSILLVEHVMRVVRDLCDHVVVLDSGVKIAEGRPEAVVKILSWWEAYIGFGMETPCSRLKTSSPATDARASCTA